MALERDGRYGGRGREPGPSSRSISATEAADRVSGPSTMRKTTLDNGLEIVSERIPGVRSAAVGVWIRRGGAHERPAESGISHMLEHMVFKGTQRRSALELARALESLGGSLDAYTSREHTSYQARVLDEHLPIALDVLADLTLAPSLRADDLELEREVVLEEIAQVEDTPDDLVFELHADRLWRGHPYGRPILGTSESVSALTAEQIRRVHSENHVGSNLVLAAAGSVDHDALVELAEKLFGGVKAGTRSAPVASPDATGQGLAQVARDSAQTHIIVGGVAPQHASKDRHPVAVLSAALGGGMSSRLFQRIREERGLCYSIFSWQSAHQQKGSVGVYVGTRPATAEAAADALREELRRVAAEGLPDDELAETKQQVKGQIMISLESTGSRLYRLASFALHSEPYLDLDGVLARIDAVSPDDIRRVGAEYFDPDRHLELRLGPGS